MVLTIISPSGANADICINDEFDDNNGFESADNWKGMIKYDPVSQMCIFLPRHICGFWFFGFPSCCKLDSSSPKQRMS